DRLKELLPADEKGGFIVRRRAESASEDELRADIDYLRHLWRVIQERALGAAPPQLLYQDLSLAQRVLRDMVSAGTARVIVDSRENFQKLAAFADSYMPRVRGRLEHYTGERPLFDMYNVETEIEKALSRDRTRMTVNGFTALGLVEMTRKRTRESLAHVLCEPCPTCGGRGEVKTPHTVCYEILREIVREARTFNAREFRVLASQAVIDVLLEDESASLAML